MPDVCQTLARRARRIPDVFQTSARRLQTIGDIIEAFEGNEADGKEARPPEHPAEANDESEEPKAIVESILDDLMNSLDGGTYIVQSILDDLFSGWIRAPPGCPGAP